MHSRFSKKERDIIKRGLALLDKYAGKGCKLNLTKYSITAKIVFPSAKATPTITWSPALGLHRLLHELGHFHVSRGRALAYHRGKRESKADELLDESRAWAWAERTAVREGIHFDYASAEGDFACYAGRDPMRVKWRFI